MYTLVLTDTFWDRYHSLITTPPLKKKVVKVLGLLAENPRHPSLRSHKVISRLYGEKWSTRVTGDLRIIWDYDSRSSVTILVLTLGSHTGKHQVYQ